MNACDKCKLALPNNYLTPVIMRNQQGQTKKGYLCTTCKAIIDAQQTPPATSRPSAGKPVNQGTPGTSG